MPANKKYLTKSPWLKALKILVGVIGGYTVSVSFSLALTKIFNAPKVMITWFLLGYLVWAVLLLNVFLAKRLWLVSLIYILLALVFSAIYHYA